MNGWFSLPRQVLISSVVALAAAACSGTQGETVSPVDGILALGPGWHTITPGGDTVCARGAPYRFFVRPGKVNRVLLDFRGGGACWDERTCSASASLFHEEATPDPWVLDETQAEGIYDHRRDDNPFKDWHHVYIPYCTGDIHWGDKVMTYGHGKGQFTIRHEGAVNVRAVLAWLGENVSDPEQIMVTGCSAGAYGSILWSAHVREQYPRARVTQLADSGAGIITDTFFQDSFPSWNAQASYPSWIPGTAPENLTSLAQLYEMIGRHYPDMVLSQYNTETDEDQSFFFAEMGGGDACDWSRQMQASVEQITETTPNFTSYLACGSRHCILGRPQFYTLETGGVKLVDWIRGMLDGRAPARVACEQPACEISQ